MDTNDKRRLASISLAGAGLWIPVLVAGILATPIEAKPLKPLEVKQRYVEILGTVAAGDPETALAELIEFETAAVGEERPWRYVDMLWRAKLQVIRDLLGAQDLDLLRPIIVLHHDAYFRFAEQDAIHLAQHSRMMASELAEIYAQRSQTPAAGSFAGWIMTSFASYLWSPSNIGLSAELFYRAHQVDPSNGLALTGEAAGWERSGNYDKAIDTLARALRLEPDEPELTLRLALCRMRSPEGSREQAQASLQALADSDAPAWIRSVAFQELARTALDDGDVDRGEELLRSALWQLPGDQQLSLQLAAVLDAQRRRGEAMTVLDGIEILGWERDSPRQTYDFWEPPDLSAERDALHDSAEKAWPALGAALRQPATGGGA